MIVEMPGELKKATKKRIAKMKAHFRERPKLKVFLNDKLYDQMIAQVGIPVSALCEHHGVAFHGEVSIAYIADKHLIGLSKLARVAEYFLNPTVFTLQERATEQIKNFLNKELKPLGLMVVIKAQHDCITYRGVKKPSTTITSSISGVFKTDPTAKSEFLQLINSN